MDYVAEQDYERGPLPDIHHHVGGGVSRELHLQMTPSLSVISRAISACSVRICQKTLSFFSHE